MRTCSSSEVAAAVSKDATVSSIRVRARHKRLTHSGIAMIRRRQGNRNEESHFMETNDQLRGLWVSLPDCRNSRTRPDALQN